MRNRSRKAPTDPNELAAYIIAQATGEEEEDGAPEPTRQKNPAAVALGRAGGLKGGKARAAKLTKEQRQEIAKKAAAARWKNKG